MAMSILVDRRLPAAMSAGRADSDEVPLATTPEKVNSS